MRCFILLLMCFAIVSCETEDKEVVLGHAGKARVNPYLAAERFLERMGTSVESLPGWMSYEDSTSFAVMPASAVGSEGIARRLSTWCENGGHLVVCLEGGEGFVNDWSKGGFFAGFGSILPELPEGVQWLQKELGVSSIPGAVTGDIEPPELEDDGSPSKEPQKRKSLLVDVEGHVIQVEDGWGMNVEQRRGYTDFTDDQTNGKHTVVSRELGYGRVTFLNHARPLRNAFIGQKDNALFLTFLQSGMNYGDSVFVYGAGTSFFTLLWRHGWRVILAVLIVLVIWLWRWLPRFGPMLAEQKDVTRDFLHHVKAWGHFLWRQKRPNELLEGLRREVMSGYEVEQINATEINRESLVDLFSQRTGIGPEDVLEALTRKDISDSTVLVKVIRNLQKMRHVV